MGDIKELEQKIIQWAKDRNIFKQSLEINRLEKFAEEALELRDAIMTEGLKEIKLEAGDVIVTLINLLHPMGLDLETCLSAAYEKIKNRTGKMENGTFVRDKPEGCEVKPTITGHGTGWQVEGKAGNINLKFVDHATIETPFKNQIGGTHYQQDYPFCQPLEFFTRNKIPSDKAKACKYALRHDRKAGLEDLRKAKHILEVMAWCHYGEEL